MVDSAVSSTVTSSQLRWILGSKLWSLCESNSPSWKNPLKHRKATAYKACLSGYIVQSHWCLTFSSAAVMIGMQTCLGPPFGVACTLQITACILFSIGWEEWSCRSGSPNEICILFTADKYILIEVYDIFSFARNETKSTLLSQRLGIMYTLNISCKQVETFSAKVYVHRDKAARTCSKYAETSLSN